ncbi:MAG: J domain-containing protein, partial [Erysipelothrix sp.]
MGVVRTCWQILEIDPTTEKKEIKKAYATKAKLVHPEENEMEFIILRSAYESALNFANNKADSQIGTAELVSESIRDLSENEGQEKSRFNFNKF